MLEMVIGFAVFVAIAGPVVARQYKIQCLEEKGEVVRGTVTAKYHLSNKMTPPRFRINYTFTDPGGTLHSGKEEISGHAADALQEGLGADVRYLPSDPSFNCLENIFRAKDAQDFHGSPREQMLKMLLVVAVGLLGAFAAIVYLGRMG